MAVQLATRFGPAVEKISEMKNIEFIYGLGLGTYLKYHGLNIED